MTEAVKTRKKITMSSWLLNGRLKPVSFRQGFTRRAIRKKGRSAATGRWVTVMNEPRVTNSEESDQMVKSTVKTHPRATARMVRPAETGRVACGAPDVCLSECGNVAVDMIAKGCAWRLNVMKVAGLVRHF